MEKKKTKKIKFGEGKVSINDLSLLGDLIWVVANYISLEQHLAQTYMKTKDENYLDIYKEIRKKRAIKLHELMITKEMPGDSWCCLKHIASLMMGLTEVGIKHKHEGNEKKAKEYFDDAGDMFDLFWLIQKLPETKKEKK